MRYLFRIWVVAWLFIIVGGCETRTIARLVPEHTELQRRSVVLQSPKLDVLFVIDNSGSMGGERASLRENFPRFVDRLRDQNQQLPSLHVGVISAEGGAGFGENCNNLAEAGKLQVEVHGLNCVEQDKPTGNMPFLFHLEGPDGTFVNNYHDNLARTFGCIAELEKKPCGTEQPLEAISRALGHPANAGFFREDAFLAVVIISDEDDCSRTLQSGEDCPSCDRGCEQARQACTESDAICEQQEQVCLEQEGNCKQNRNCPYANFRYLDASQLPAVASTSDFRCVEEAVTCSESLRSDVVDGYIDDNGTEVTGDDLIIREGQTVKSNCRAKTAAEIEAAGGLLTPYEEYAASLIRAKGAADKVIVAAIVGEGEQIVVQDENSRDGRVKFGTVRTCNQAIAANRIRAFADSFGVQSAKVSICNGPPDGDDDDTNDIPDLSGALEIIGTQIDQRIRSACFSDAIDLDANTKEVETDCVVSIVDARGDKQVLTKCADPLDGGAAPRCWTFERDTARCTDSQVHLRFPNLDLPAKSQLAVECLVVRSKHR